MLDMNNALQLYRGKDFKLTNSITIRQPTLEEICEYGEMKYFSMLNVFVSTPFDMIAQLDSINIDFTQISEFDLFILLVKQLKKEDTNILFGDVDFSQYELKQTDDGGYVLCCGSSIISEPIYKIMAEYIRKIHNFSKQRYNSVANDFAKEEMIKEAYDEIEKAKRKRKQDSSILLPLISSLVNYDGFKYNQDTVWGMKIYAFFDAIKRIQTYENVSHIYTGIYSGSVDFDKVKKDLNWMENFS